MKLAALALLVCAAGADNPLAPMAGIAKSLDARMAAFIGGKKAAEAFEHDGTDGPSEKIVRDAIENHKIAKAETLMIQTELHFLEGKKSIYRVVVLFAMQDGAPKLLGFKGGRDGGLRAKPVGEYEGELAPVGDFAKQIAAFLAGDAWKEAPWADAEFFRKRDPASPFLEELERELKKGKDSIADVAAKVATLKYDGLAAGFDDHFYLARNADGKLLGTIRAQIRTRPGKPVAYVLDNFIRVDDK